MAKKHKKAGQSASRDAFERFRELKIESKWDGRLYRDPVDTLERPAVQRHLRRLKELEAEQG